MRRKTARLEEALDCSFFTEEHAFILEMMLDSIDQLTAQIEILDDKIAEMCKPYERQVKQLDGIPGFGITRPRTSRRDRHRHVRPLDRRQLASSRTPIDPIDPPGDCLVNRTP